MGPAVELISTTRKISRGSVSNLMPVYVNRTDYGLATRAFCALFNQPRAARLIRRSVVSGRYRFSQH